MSILICPICGGELVKSEKAYTCSNSHSFDIAKEGYVNLITGSKSGDKRGDSKESCSSRHLFLEKGYYRCLKDALFEKAKGTVLDICCGEGYYDTGYQGDLYGFDISKEMVRLASKRKNGGTYFAANLTSIPVKDASIDTAFHLFAPFCDREFARVLKDDGRLFSVIPGKDHIFEIKNIVYDTPYRNDEKAPDTQSLTLVNRQSVTGKVKMTKEDIFTLFSMTPYFYRSPKEGIQRLHQCNDMEITVDFVILEYKKCK